jgi:hypothetical protein
MCCGSCRCGDGFGQASQEAQRCYLPRCPLGERGRGPVDLGSIDVDRVDVGVFDINPAEIASAAIGLVEIEQGGIRPGDAAPCASSRDATATSEVPVTAAVSCSVAPRW